GRGQRAGRGLRGKDPEGREPGLAAGGAAHSLRARGQSQDRGDPRHQGAGAADRPRRPRRQVARGRGNTNFCSATSRGHTTRGACPRICSIAVEAFGLSPTSLKTTGPVETVTPPAKDVLRIAATTASGSVEAARSSTSAMTWIAS